MKKWISEKQLEILKFPFRKEYQALICDGAVRSGKTSIMTIAFVDWAMRKFDGVNFAICGRTVGSVIKNIITPYLPLAYHRARYAITFTRADNKMVVSCGACTNTFYVYGGKDESSYMLIQGITLGGVLLDEVTLMPQSFVNQALARCSVEGARFWFNCNPASPTHWFYNEWVRPENHAAKKVLRVHFLLADNPGLSQETLDRYHSIYSGVFYDRYILGEWVKAEGLIYRVFAEGHGRFVVPDIKAWLQEQHKGIALTSFGVDFGGNRSATAMVAVGFTRQWDAVVLDEVYVPGGEPLDPDQLNSKFAEFVRRVHEQWPGGDTRADSAETILIRGLWNTALRQGLKTNVKNALKKEINDRIELENLLMSQNRLKVAAGCRHLIRAFDDAVYDEKEQTKDKRLDDGSTNIDSLDAFEYAIEPYYKQLTDRAKEVKKAIGLEGVSL